MASAALLEDGDMYVRNWLGGIRLFLGFLLAPAIVSVCLVTSLDMVLARLGAHPDGPTNVMIGAFVGVVGLVVPYLGALCLGLPYVIILLGRRWLNFRAVMIATLIFALVYPAIVYLSLCDTLHPSHPLAEAVAAPQIAAVLLSGLCFYFIGVWELRKEPP